MKHLLFLAFIYWAFWASQQNNDGIIAALRRANEKNKITVMEMQARHQNDLRTQREVINALLKYINKVNKFNHVADYIDTTEVKECVVINN